MIRLRARLALGATLVALLPAVGAGQTTCPPAERTGALVLAHGAGPEWNARVREVVDAADLAGPIEVSFLMGPDAERRPFQAAVASLVADGAERVVVVPMLVSSHSGHYEQIRWLAGETDSLSPVMRHHLEMSGIERPDGDVPIDVLPALDDADELADVLSARARALAEDPSTQALFLVGHGPNSAEDHARWMENLRGVAERVAATSPFVDVKVGLVRDDAPAPVRAEAVRAARETIDLQRRLTGRPVVVVPVLISEGRVSREKIPADLAGLDITYDGIPLLPHEGLARWIERRVADGVGPSTPDGACGATDGPPAGD